MSAYYIWDEESNGWFSGFTNGKPYFDYSFTCARNYVHKETAFGMVDAIKSAETCRKFELMVFAIEKILQRV